MSAPAKVGTAAAAPSVIWVIEVAAGAMTMELGLSPPRRDACGGDDMGALENWSQVVSLIWCR
jgi:hypothetical protein